MTIQKWVVGFITGLFFVLSTHAIAHAQLLENPIPTLTTEEATLSAEALAAKRLKFALNEATVAAKEASPSAEEIKKLEELKKEDVTQPEETKEKVEVFALFIQRPVKKLTVTNFMAYAVQYAVRKGIPANTIILIILLPFLATMVAFLRHIVGLPGFEMLVPIALSITFVATGLPTGLLILSAILLATFVSRWILRPVRIMQLPKVALSQMVVAVFVFAVLTISVVNGVLVIRQLSIFPVLLLILLSEQIVRLQLQSSLRSTLYITGVTLLLGTIGFEILTAEGLRNFVLLYPEVALLLIPINIAIGRYFGLRLTEYFRFGALHNTGISNSTTK